MFSVEDVRNLPADPRKAILEVADKVSHAISLYASNRTRSSAPEYKAIIRAYSLIEVLLNKIEKDFPHSLDIFEADRVSLYGSQSDVLGGIRRYCGAIKGWAAGLMNEIETQEMLNNGKEEFINAIAGFGGYSLSEKEYSLIQSKINEMRAIIAKSKHIADEHKTRMLQKLESLQSEIHKRMSSLTKSLGIIVEIGTTIGTFGVKVKPATDRLREILQVLLKSKSEAEGLPQGKINSLALPDNGEE